MRAALAATAVAVVAAAACVSEHPRAPLPAPVPVVTVTMTEYSFQLDRAVPSGRVVFRMRNVGRLAHSATLLPLPEDLPPIQVQLQGTERRYLAPFAGVPERPPDTSRSFAVELQPGVRYAMICYTIDPDRQNHASKGMSTEFRTAGPPLNDRRTPSETAPVPPVQNQGASPAS